MGTGIQYGVPGLAIYGTGKDGIVTISSTTSLIRDMYCKDLTITNSGILCTNGYRIFVQRRLLIQNGGIIHNDGGNAAGTTPGNGAPSATIGGGQNGGAVNSSAGTLINGYGGDGGTGIASGGHTATNVRNGNIHDNFVWASGGWILGGGVPTKIQGGCGGGGGTGCAGGGGGGVVFIAVKDLVIEKGGVIRSAGGRGGNGAVLSGGGGGGVIIIRCGNIQAVGIELPMFMPYNYNASAIQAPGGLPYFGTQNKGNNGSVIVFSESGTFIQLGSEPNGGGPESSFANDHLVKATGSDTTTPGSLQEKLKQGNNITLTVITENNIDKIKIDATNDHLVKASNNDTTIVGGLYEKTKAGDNVTITEITENGVNKVKIDATGVTLGNNIQSVGTANSGGSSSHGAKEDHVHNHGAQPLGDGTNHAVATTSVAGFMSLTDKTKLDSLTVTGTLGYLAKFTDQHVVGDSVIFEDSERNIGIGTSSVENSEGWHKVLEVHGTDHSKVLVTSTTNSVTGGVWTNGAGFFNSGAPGSFIGTWSNHPLWTIINKIIVGKWSSTGLDITGNITAANITATPTASKIPIADGSGTLNSWISGLHTGSGDNTYLTKWTGTYSQGDSIITDNGSTATVNGALSVTGNVSAANITATPTASKIPIANASGNLNSWISGLHTGSGDNTYLTKWTGTYSQGDSIITDNGSTATVNGALSVTGNVSAANITATPTASKIPIADGSGTLNSWISGLHTGSGNNTYLTKWTGTYSQGNSIITDNGSTATVNGALSVTGNVSAANINDNPGANIIVKAGAGGQINGGFFPWQGGIPTAPGVQAPGPGSSGWVPYGDHRHPTMYHFNWAADYAGTGEGNALSFGTAQYYPLLQWPTDLDGLSNGNNEIKVKVTICHGGTNTGYNQFRVVIGSASPTVHNGSDPFVYLNGAPPGNGAFGIMTGELNITKPNTFGPAAYILVLGQRYNEVGGIGYLMSISVVITGNR